MNNLNGVFLSFLFLNITQITNTLGFLFPHILPTYFYHPRIFISIFFLLLFSFLFYSCLFVCFFSFSFFFFFFLSLLIWKGSEYCTKTWKECISKDKFGGIRMYMFSAYKLQSCFESWIVIVHKGMNMV